MYCRLSAIVGELKKSYPIKATRQMSGTVKSIARLPTGTEASLDPEILYVVTPDGLSAHGPRLESVPILCVAESIATIDTALFPKRKVMIVQCDSVTDVLLRLTEIMFALGRKSSDISELSGRLLGCDTCRKLIDKGSEVLGNPLALTDALLNVIEYTRDGLVGSDAWNDFITSGHLAVNTANLGSIISEASSPASQAACITLEEKPGKPPMIQKAIIAQGHFLGYLLAPALLRPFEDGDMEICDLIGNLAAVVLLRTDNVINPAGSVEAYLGTLIDSSSFSPEEADTQIKKLGWTPKPYLYVLLLSNNGQLIGKNLRETSREIQAALPGTRSITHKNGTVFLWETTVILVENDKRLTPLFNLLTAHTSRIGISRSFTSPLQMRSAFYQARKALELGEMLEPGYRVHPYERYGTYHMLEMCASYEDLSTFVYPGFEQLQRYDRENDGELVKTLFAYLETCGNLTKTASALFVHQNTIRYRIAQISRILRCELLEGETFFQLMLTQKIQSLRDGYSPNKRLEIEERRAR